MTETQAAFLATVVFLCLLGVNIWYFFVRPARPWSTRLGVVLQIVGIYTFLFGVASKMDVLPKDLLEEMTSSDLFSFLGGNLRALGILFLALSMGADPEKTSESSSEVLELLFPLAFAPLAVVTAAFHLVVVVPLAYIAYVAAAVPVTAIERAATEFAISSGGVETSIKTLVASNAVAIKNLAIAFPALMLRVTFDIAALQRREPPAVAIEAPDRPSWISRHARVGRLLLRVCQGVLAAIVFTAVWVTALLPWLSSTRQAGEIVGVAIVTMLIVWVLVAVIIKAERVRRRLRNAKPTATTRTKRLARQLAVASGIAVAAIWLYAVIDTWLQSISRCESGDGHACTLACESDVAAACSRLGDMYANGTNGVEKDTARAAELYQTACDGGSAASCHKLALMYAQGAGARSRDLIRVRKLYEQACDGGEWSACTRLGTMYAAGQDCACADVERAAVAFQKACDHAEVDGCTQLIHLYTKRNSGIFCDPSKAEKY